MGREAEHTLHYKLRRPDQLSLDGYYQIPTRQSANSEKLLLPLFPFHCLRKVLAIYWA